MRILFLTHRLPYAPNRGDRIRAFHLLKFFETFAKVDLLSFAHSAEEAGHAGELRSPSTTVRVAMVPRLRNAVRGAALLPSGRPLTHALLDAPGFAGLLREAVTAARPDVVVTFCSGMARFALEPPLADLPFILEMVDVDSAKWSELATKSGAPLNWVYRREARCLSRFEAAAAERAVANVVINEREHRLLIDMAPRARVITIPSGVDLESFRAVAPPEPSQEVVFCGVMDYPPNEAAAVWLASEVWPRVRAAVPAATLTLVGSNPTARVRALADVATNITVTGQVAQVQPYLWRAAVSVAPLHTARGLQNKVLEAVAAGLPAVVTPAVAAGLPVDIDGAYKVADSAADFAQAICDLLALTPEQRRAVAESARLSAVSWPERLAPFRALLEEAAGGAR